MLDSVSLGRGEGCKPSQCQVLSPLFPLLQQFMCEGMRAAWLEQSAAKSSLSCESHLGGHFQAWSGLSVSSVVTLKNKKNILKTGILKIRMSSGQKQDVHLPRDALSKKLLMELLYLAAIQLAKKCSAIHYNIKFSLKNLIFWNSNVGVLFPLRQSILCFSFMAWP